MDHNPLLREARLRAQQTYEKSEQTHADEAFKSRRPNQKAWFEEGKHQEDAYDWHQEKFLRRQMWSHLRSDSSVPMSIRNVDRHGLGNLKHEDVKPFDRLKVPPFLIYGIVFGALLYFAALFYENDELRLETLQKRNLLLAMKRTQEREGLGEDEISGGEELTMKTKQYKEGVEKAREKEQRKVSQIKQVFLSDKQPSQVNIDSLINKS